MFFLSFLLPSLLSFTFSPSFFFSSPSPLPCLLPSSFSALCMYSYHPIFHHAHAYHEWYICSHKMKETILNLLSLSDQDLFASSLSVDNWNKSYFNFSKILSYINTLHPCQKIIWRVQNTKKCLSWRKTEKNRNNLQWVGKWLIKVQQFHIMTYYVTFKSNKTDLCILRLKKCFESRY